MLMCPINLEKHLCSPEAEVGCPGPAGGERDQGVVQPGHGEAVRHLSPIWYHQHRAQPRSSGRGRIFLQKFERKSVLLSVFLLISLQKIHSRS